MAVTKKPASPQDLAFESLQSMLEDPRPRGLYGVKGASAIFPGTKAEMGPAARIALESGWIEPTGDFLETGAGKKKTRTELFRLTPRGVAALVNQGNSPQLLDALKKAVETLAAKAAVAKDESKQQAAQLTQAFHHQCAGLLHEVAQAVKTIQAQCEAVNRNVEEKLTTFHKHLLPDPSGVDTLRNAVEQLACKLTPVDVNELARKMATPSPAVSVPQPAAGESQGWLEEVVRMVVEQKQRHSYQALTLTQIFDRLRSSRPQLTLGQFHDGLRRLHKERRIRLAPYTLALATLDDPRNALYLDNEVKYYVEPAH